MVNDFSLNHKIGILSLIAVEGGRKSEYRIVGCFILSLCIFTSAETSFHCYQTHAHTPSTCFA